MNILISKFSSSKPARLTKTLYLQGEEIVSRRGGHMVLGSVQVLGISCLRGLGEVIMSLEKNQALCFGLPKGAKAGYENDIKVEKLVTENDEAIARSNNYFEWNLNGSGILMLDYDPNGCETPLAPEELVEQLRLAVPELKNVKMLWLPSASSDIYNRETDEKLSGTRGQRLYITCNRAVDIPEFGKIIFKRLWLANKGFVKVGSRGQRLVRSLIDATVWQPSRLDFVFGADCVPPLEQRRSDPVLFPGELDTLASMMPLSQEEEDLFSKLVRDEKDAAKPIADEKFRDYLEIESAKLPVYEREDYKTTQRTARDSSCLFGDFELIVIDREGFEKVVRVQEILEDPKKYDKCRTLDPLDPEYGDWEDVGILNLLGGKPNLYCFNRQTYYKLLKPNEFGLPDGELTRLAEMPPVEYERVRKDSAKVLGVRVTLLDQAVEEQRDTKVSLSASNSLLPEWDIPSFAGVVSPGNLADEIFDCISKYLVADKLYLMIITMWIMLSWLFEKTTIFPRLVVTAPDKGCGKTVCLSIIGLLAQRSLQSSSISPASFYRLVETLKPTILIDEADTLPKDSDQLRGLLNAGHTKESANIIRTEGVNGKYTPVIFKCFCPVALAGIKLEKKLPETVLSRGIIINLRKKLRNEKVQKLRRASKGQFLELQSKLARFAKDFGERFRIHEPDLGDLDNRDEDNWEPLLTIAELCGGDWPKRIMEAAVALSDNANSESIDVTLLRDVRNIFNSQKQSEMTSKSLIDALCKIEAAPWNTFRRGNAIDSRQLAYRLDSFGIRPKQLGKNAGKGKNPRGYKLNDFQDAFNRYLEDPSNDCNENLAEIVEQQRAQSAEEIMEKSYGQDQE